MMDWWQALILGIVQGLTEFLPVSSSGHLIIFKNLLGVDAEGFMDFTVTVHFATVMSTLVIFRKEIWALLKGLFQIKYNDATDYVLKIVVSIIPVAIVGLFFKDYVESLFGEGVAVVGIFLIVTALLLFLSDFFSARSKGGSRLCLRGISDKESDDGSDSAVEQGNAHRNGISYIQAFIVGLAQSFAVAPGLSRSGTTIATGLLCGVRRDVMAQFSFLMVLVPIVGEQILSVASALTEGVQSALPFADLILGFAGAFIAGLVSCKAMIALVKKARLSYFAIYCLVAAAIILFLLEAV